MVLVLLFIVESPFFLLRNHDSLRCNNMVLCDAWHFPKSLYMVSHSPGNVGLDVHLPTRKPKPWFSKSLGARISEQGSPPQVRHVLAKHMAYMPA